MKCSQWTLPPTPDCIQPPTSTLLIASQLRRPALNIHISWLVRCFNGNKQVEPMTSRTLTSYISTYDKTFLHWSRFGHVPSFVRLDAETSTDLEQFLKNKKKVTFQYLPTGTHRANRAERCIRTWKNHFTSTLATASSKFPMSYWNKLIHLVELTLNCFLPWQPNPAISAFHGLTGAPFDFRAHPIARPVRQHSFMRHLKNGVHGQRIGLITWLSLPRPLHASHGFPKPTLRHLYLL